MSKNLEEIISNEPQYTIFKPDIMMTAVSIENFLEMRDYYRQSISQILEEHSK